MSAVAMALLGIGAAHANIVTNGGFESGSSGWLIGEFGVSNTWGVGGSNVALTGCIGHSCVDTPGTGSSIQQNLVTTPGQTYKLSFWVGEDAGPTSEMSVFWNGGLVADILNPANNTIDFNTNPGMVEFTFSNLLATDSVTSPEIHGRRLFFS